MSRCVGWSSFGFALPARKPNARLRWTLANVRRSPGFDRTVSGCETFRDANHYNIASRTFSNGRCNLFLGRRVPWSGHHRFGNETGIGADSVFDRFTDFAMVFQIGFGVLATLTDSLALVGEP